MADVLRVGHQGPMCILLTGVACLLVLRRGNRPVLVNVALLVPAFFTQALVAPLLAVHAVARRERSPWILSAVVALDLGTMTVSRVVMSEVPPTHLDQFLDHLTRILLVGMAATAGVWHRRRETCEPARTETPAQADAVRRAVVEERLRLAREMHDVLGHGLSLIALRASLLTGDHIPSEISEKSDQIHELATKTLAELREIIVPLRDPEIEDGDAGRLVRELVALHEDVTLRTCGDLTSVSGRSARVLVRVVQEALTNARRHAPGSRVTVSISRLGESLDVRIHNGPPGAENRGSPIRDGPQSTGNRRPQAKDTSGEDPPWERRSRETPPRGVAQWAGTAKPHSSPGTPGAKPHSSPGTPGQCASRVIVACQAVPYPGGPHAALPYLGGPHPGGSHAGAPDPDGPHPGGPQVKGSGLRGMRERVRHLGGALRHGGTGDGGYLLHAVIPVNADPPPVSTRLL
ncbi:histidine kinase [Sinosporangium siamense]|nr:histidine kinase [Sinosporangium siamense]